MDEDRLHIEMLDDLELSTSTTTPIQEDMQTLMTVATDPSAKAGLLTLPPEIRLRIYRYLLVGRSPRTINYRTCSEVKCKLMAPRSLQSRYVPESGVNSAETCYCWSQLWTPILESCKLIHTEAIHVLYAENKFEVEAKVDFARVKATYFDASDTHNFFKQIGATNISTIQDLTISLYPGCLESKNLSRWYDILIFLADRMNLKTLTIKIAGGFSFGFLEVWKQTGYAPELAKLLLRFRKLEKLQLGGPFHNDWNEMLKEEMPDCSIVRVSGLPH